MASPPSAGRADRPLRPAHRRAAGALLLGLAGARQPSHQPLEFQVVYGVIVGGAAGAVFAR